MKIELSGKYKLRLIRKGKVIRQASGKNLITNAGENLVAELLDYSATPDEPQYFSTGSGTSAPLKTDVTLGSEMSQARQAAAAVTRVNGILTLTFAFTASAPLTVTEMGIFNASAAGDMMSRFLIQTLNMAAADTLAIDWALTISGVD